MREATLAAPPGPPLPTSLPGVSVALAASVTLYSLSLSLVGGQALAGSVDYTGIAALVTAFSGLIATVGAIYLGARRRDDSTAKAIELLKELQAKDEEP